MQRDLNQMAKNREGEVINDGKKDLSFADFVVPALDMYGGGKARDVTALADKIHAARDPAVEVDITPADAQIISEALEQRGLAAIVRTQITAYVEPK